MAGVTGSEGADAAETPFDAGERLAWAGRADAFAAGFGRLCAYTVPRLLDAAGVTEGTRALDAGTGTGTAAAAAIWPAPPAPGQALLGRAVRAAGVPRPADLPALAPEDDFPRTERGLAELLVTAGPLMEVGCSAVSWEHRTTAEEWWHGQAAGVATIGRVVTSRGPGAAERVRRRFLDLAAEFTLPDGQLSLPHTALLASGRVAG